MPNSSNHICLPPNAKATKSWSRPACPVEYDNSLEKKDSMAKKDKKKGKKQAGDW